MVGDVLCSSLLNLMAFPLLTGVKESTSKMGFCFLTPSWHRYWEPFPGNTAARV
jgi:hypothetical protein